MSRSLHGCHNVTLMSHWCHMNAPLMSSDCHMDFAKMSQAFNGHNTFEWYQEPRLRTAPPPLSQCLPQPVEIRRFGLVWRECEPKSQNARMWRFLWKSCLIANEFTHTYSWSGIITLFQQQMPQNPFFDSAAYEEGNQLKTWHTGSFFRFWNCLTMFWKHQKSCSRTASGLYINVKLTG